MDDLFLDSWSSKPKSKGRGTPKHIYRSHGDCN